jgi:small multidrug resistance pump
MMSEVTQDTPVRGQRLVTSWLLLFGAIALEIVATSLLPTTQTFTLPVPSGVVLILYAVSYFLLSRCLGRIPLGVAYAVWSGAGTAAVAVIGIALLGKGEVSSDQPVREISERTVHADSALVL